MKSFILAVLLGGIGAYADPLAEAIKGATQEKSDRLSPNLVAKVMGSNLLRSVTLYIPTGKCAPEPVFSSTTTIISSTTTTWTSTIVKTSQISSSTSSTKAISTLVTAPCPIYIAAPYKSKASVEYQIFCTTKLGYSDVLSVHTETFEECITACDTYVPPKISKRYGDDARPCVAVTWSPPINNPGRNCWLKGDIFEAIYGRTRFSSAKKVSYAIPSDLQVAVVDALFPEPTDTIEPVAPCPVCICLLYKSDQKS